MQVHFFKYHGTGNDFILLDNREGMYFTITNDQIKKMCERHFGIGADGLMLLEKQEGYDFRMIYYNSNGNESTMCGNGGRCITAFAKKLDIISTQAHFMAIDGEHFSTIDENNWVELHMKNVDSIIHKETYKELNTGSPHYVHFTEYVKEMDVKKEGALIRFSPQYKEQGINVNFVEPLSENKIFVRTYERGVEDETLSCGTGVTASSISFKSKDKGRHQIDVETLGGELKVHFENENNSKFKNIILAGKAEFVFEGDIYIS